jgi:RHS repeat-associated protein
VRCAHAGREGIVVSPVCPRISSLFSSVIYNALGSVTSDTLGNGSETLTYDKRGRLSTFAATGPDPGHNTSATGSVSISGTEQSVGTSAGTATITIGGTEGKLLNGPCKPTCSYTYDTGTITVTIGGHVDSVTYGQNSDTTNIASALKSAITGDSQALVNASSSGSVLTVTSEALGTVGNYTLSTNVVSNDPSDFTPPSFTATRSGANLTGGTNTYDSGTVSATVNGRAETVNYGQSDTPTTIATNLLSTINGDSSAYATATRSGTTLFLTSKTGGSGGNYSLSAPVTYNSSKFSHSSFSTSPSGANLTGGVNGLGNIYNLSLGYAPNGDVTAANDTVNGNWTYKYDDFNRLLSGTLGSAVLSWTYDQNGNRWTQTASGSGSGSWPQPQYSFTGNNNHLDASDGVLYDAAGNMTKDPVGTIYYYDAENRIIQVGGGTKGDCAHATACYTYDAEGRRAQKTLGASTVNYLYDLSAHQVAEVSSSGTWNRGEVYAGGRHLATYTGGASGATYFNTGNWLGTERMRTSLTAITETCTSLPFGDDLTCTGTDTSPMHFTGKQRDTESILDYFGARYYTSTEGRFMTPDWSASPTADPYADFSNPQSLNLYSYTKNSPVAVKDADGHCGEDVCVVETLTGITILVMATHAYYAMPPEQRNFGTALSQATSSLSNAISGLLHPNNAGQNAPPPPSVPTNVSQGTPGTTASSVPQGTPASTSQAGAINTGPMPLIVVSPGGDAVPIPNGASGPVPVVNNSGNTTGFGYTGGSGGYGLDSQTTGVRIMDPTPARGASPGYPNGYVSYNNQ